MGKSEYRSAFRSKPACSAQVYESNVDYRFQRRQIEHGHHSDPFVWPGDPESDSDNSSDEGIQRLQVKQHQNGLPRQEKHMKYVKVPQQLQTKKVSVMNGLHDDRSLDEEVDIPKLDIEDLQINESTQNGSHNHAPTCPKYTTDPSSIASGSSVCIITENAPAKRNKDNKSVQRPQKPRQRIRLSKKTLPKPRSMSAPLGRPAKKPICPEDEKVPFVPYGCKDRDRDTGIKKTHNVRASVDVYPAALRAQKRRQQEIAQRERQARLTPSKQRHKVAQLNRFDQKMQKETAHWDTEYSSHYLGFEKIEYTRSNSARAPNPRAVDHNEMGQLPPEHPCSYLRASF